MRLLTLLVLLFSNAQAKQVCSVINIPINIFVQNDSPWTETEILDRIKGTQEIYNHCQVDFTIESIKFGYQDGLRFMKNRDIDQLFTQHNPNPQKGIYLIFTQAELSVNKSAYSRIELFNENPLSINSAFFFSKTVLFEMESPNYNVVAHEMAHILLNEEHNNINKNILSVKYDGMNVSPEQCQKIHERWSKK